MPYVGQHRPQRVRDASVVARVQADEQIDLMLGLHQRDRLGLEALLLRQADPASGDFRRYLSPVQFGDRFGLSAAEYDEVASVIERAGLTITRRTDGRTTLSVRGPAAAIERLFDTELDIYEDRRGANARFRAPSERFAIPTSLVGLVEHVVGLDDAYPYRPHFKAGGAGFGEGASPRKLPSFAEPADLQNIYGATNAKHPITNQPLLGAGETVAILGTGFGPEPDDLTGFIAKYALPTNPAAQYAMPLLGGPNRDPIAFANNEYGENVLDIDMVWALAPLANVVHVITASNAPGLFGDGITFIVNQVPQAHAVTVSYGTCERVAISEILTMNALFIQAKAGGQAWFIASGDNGTDGCGDGVVGGVLAVDWPASSPYVFGVGGTQIAAGVETAWFGGGGGLSEVFPKPTWQAGLGDYANVDARSVPDVSALAGDPGVAVWAQGSVQVSEGTSAAAPMWGGIWALIDEARGNTGMSDYHERIYALGKLHTGAFRDIIGGANGDGTTEGYKAVAGFDLATGWGVPNVELLVGGLP